MHSWDALLDIVVLLAGALLLGALMARLKQSAILGYLLAGTLLGPNGLHVIKDEKTVEAIAELGVALLLFSLGLEFSWNRLRSLGKPILVGGFVQIGITISLCMGAGIMFGLSAPEAFVVGAMVALSSTACVLRVLMDRAAIESNHGRAAVGILLVQDIAVVPLALTVNVLGKGGTPGEVALYIGQILLYAAGLIAALWLLLNKVAVWGLGTLTMARNRELTILLAVVVGLGAAFAAYKAELSPALGAFVAGMFLGSSPFAAQVRADVSSLRIVLLTLFFSAAGMLGDPGWMIRNLPLLIALTAAVILINAVVGWLVLRKMGVPHAVAAGAGISLAQMSEFAFVLGLLAVNVGVLPQLVDEAGNKQGSPVFMAMASTAIVTLFLTPYLIAAAPTIGMWLDRKLARGEGARAAAAGHGPGEHEPEVIIIGFGPAGQRVGQSLANSGREVLVIDQNRDAERHTRPLGLHFMPGDATKEEVLEHAHVSQARVVVITLPTPEITREVLRTVRHLAPGAHIIVRARYHMYASTFESAGAHAVVDEEKEVGKRLAVMLRSHLGEAHAEPVIDPENPPPL